VLWFAAGLVAFAVVLHLGLAWMYFSFRSAEDREKGSAYPEEFTESTSRLPQTPRLEGIESRSGGAVEVSREEELHRYGWVESYGIGIAAGGYPGATFRRASIPIDEAFSRLLSKEPKVRDEKQSRRWRDRGEMVPTNANSGRGTKEER